MTPKDKVAVATDASIDQSTALPAPGPSESDGGPAPIELVDSPAWPAGQKRVKLTWAVPPPTPDPDRPGEGMGKRDVHLVVSVGPVARRVSLGALQEGPVSPEHQLACARSLGRPPERSAKGGRDAEDLAALPFGRDGDYGYAVRRDTPTSIAVVAYSQDDGNCPDDKGEARPCPKQSVVIRRVQIPKSATFEETIVGVDGAGKEHPFPCGL